MKFIPTWTKEIVYWTQWENCAFQCVLKNVLVFNTEFLTRILKNGRAKILHWFVQVITAQWEKIDGQVIEA